MLRIKGAPRKARSTTYRTFRLTRSFGLLLTVAGLLVADFIYLAEDRPGTVLRDRGWRDPGLYWLRFR